METMGRYRYTRNGETFTIGTDGLTITDADGDIMLDRVTPVPADVIASTVIDLTLAGWVPAGE